MSDEEGGLGRMRLLDLPALYTAPKSNYMTWVLFSKFDPNTPLSPLAAIFPYPS